MNEEKALVSASLLAADFSRLGQDIERIEKAGADWLHFDVMDGCFVPNISFGSVVLKSIRKCVTKPVDVHLMIVEPVRYVEDFAKAGASLITVHAEAADDILPALKKIRDCGCKAGISVKPGTPVNAAEPYLDIIDLILIMTVEPGFGGQSFMTETLDKITEAKRLADGAGHKIYVEVDGGINDDTAQLVKAHGADVLVSGSYLFGAEDPTEAIVSIKGH